MAAHPEPPRRSKRVPADPNGVRGDENRTFKALANKWIIDSRQDVCRGPISL
jgi:hypothetical protein